MCLGGKSKGAPPVPAPTPFDNASEIERGLPPDPDNWAPRQTNSGMDWTPF